MPTKNSLKTIKIGVSSCLLGLAVRYDGKDKRHKVVTEILCQYFECVPICPEMAIGLGSPRPPVQLVTTTNGIRAVGRNDPAIDITNRLLEYSREIHLDHLSGMVLKSRSPSCGLGSTPLFDGDHREIRKVSGLFTESILLRDDKFPVIEDTDLEDETRLNAFINDINAR
jgi:uncharacterized protein YbbK (DUF523 family)